MVDRSGDRVVTEIAPLPIDPISRKCFCRFVFVFVLRIILNILKRLLLAFEILYLICCMPTLLCHFGKIVLNLLVYIWNKQCIFRNKLSIFLACFLSVISLAFSFPFAPGFSIHLNQSFFLLNPLF